MSITSDKTGVILMTYGSATTAEHVPTYFERIYKGKASANLVRDFENRYRSVSRSPLVEITNSQAAHLEQLLGDTYVVRAGMRHSAPFIEDSISECRDAGATSLMGVILSPQFSSSIMEGYKTAFREAALRHGFDARQITIAEPWSTEPHFIELLAARVTESLEALTQTYEVSVPVIFSTHSLPKRVIDSDPGYLEQIQGTIDAVRRKLDSNLEWYAAYQSAGHTPESWLKPDLVDILRELHEKKSPAVLIVPIQFVADHLEILYDLDIAARAQCEALGLAYHRISLPNTDPLFIEALAAVARDTERKILSKQTIGALIRNAAARKS